MQCYGKVQIVPGILKAGEAGIFGGQTRILMLSHAAAITPSGATSVDWVREQGFGTVTGVMGPEHGFLGHAAAGASCRSFRHPLWKLPVYSLYGKNRAPQRAWLRKADVLLIDLQDLGYRPYTYVSTLYLALQAAARMGLPVVVADRPIPLPETVDGPMLDASFSSFVGLVPVPFCYGMTPGEMARWIQRYLLPDLALTVLPMAGFRRAQTGLRNNLPWVSPSPSIRSPETAVVYPATVGLEGLPHIDHGRKTSTPFQLVGARWIEPDVLVRELRARQLPGIAIHAHVYVPVADGKPTPGIRITVLDEGVYRPAAVMVHLLHALTVLYGCRRVWGHPLARSAFFDKLMGTDRVRTALMAGSAPGEIIDAWPDPVFMRQRKGVLLY